MTVKPYAKIGVKGYWYTLQFSPSNVPPGAYITNVSWSWNVSNYRSDLQVLLNLPYYGYLDISFMGSGSHSGFNNQNANQSFYMYFGINGIQGEAINPAVYGGYDTVIVSWSTN